MRSQTAASTTCSGRIGSRRAASRASTRCAHLERAMSGRELSIAYKAITVNELSGDLVAVSGEAVFAGDVDYQGVFYFGASCLATDAGVLLTKMKIDRVNRSGHSHRSLQMAAMDMSGWTKAPRLISSTGSCPWVSFATICRATC